jgi:hypothetical protein
MQANVTAQMAQITRDVVLLLKGGGLIKNRRQYAYILAAVGIVPTVRALLIAI